MHSSLTHYASLTVKVTSAAGMRKAVRDGREVVMSKAYQRLA
jgi:hypothetical protein